MHASKNSFAGYLADVEIVPVILAVGISLIWSKFLLAAVLTAAFFWLVRLPARKRLTVRTPADWGILLLVIMLPITWWITNAPEKTQPQVLRLLSGIALYYALVNWCSSTRRLRMMLPAYTLAGLGLVLVAPFSVNWALIKLPFIPTTLFQQLPVQFSDTIHPNVLAGTLVILLPIVLGQVLFAWRDLAWFERILNSITLILMLAVLVLTLSRGAWMALGAVLLVLVTLRWRWGWIALALAAGAALVIVNRIGIDQVVQIIVSSSSIGGLDGRLEIWSRAGYMLQDFPLTGIGMGSFMEAADGLYPFFIYEPGAIHHAHNLFLQVGVDLGIPGLIGWMLVFGVTTWQAFYVYRTGKRQPNRLFAGLGAGLLCSQLALAVHGLTDAVTWGMVRPAPFVWALWGLAAVLAQLTHQPLPEAEQAQVPVPAPAAPSPAGTTAAPATE